MTDDQVVHFKGVAIPTRPFLMEHKDRLYQLVVHGSALDTPRKAKDLLRTVGLRLRRRGAGLIVNTRHRNARPGYGDDMYVTEFWWTTNDWSP